MIKVINTPYVYEGEFTNTNGDKIQYCQLRVDVQIGDTVKPLTYKLRGFEAEYIKSLLASEFVDD